MANAGNPQMAQAPQTGQQAQNPQGIGANIAGRNPMMGASMMPQSLSMYENISDDPNDLHMQGIANSAFGRTINNNLPRRQMPAGFASGGTQAPINLTAMTDPTSVPEGSYIGPLGGGYKNGENPMSEYTQPMVSPKRPQFPSHWEEDRSFYARKGEIDEARRQRQQDPVAMAELERINSTFKAPMQDQPMKPPQAPQPNTPDLYAGPDYSKEQMGMGGALPKGYYVGPTDETHKYGEGPQAVQTQQFLDNNPDYLTGGTQAPQRPSDWQPWMPIDESMMPRPTPYSPTLPQQPQILQSPQDQGMGGTISDMLPNMQDKRMQIMQARRMMEAQRVTPPQGQNIFEQSAGAYRGALDAAGQPTATGSIANTDLSQYTNPYEAQVVQNTMDDLERTRLMQQNQMSASASSAGAFGGSRQGIAEAETNLGFARQAANTAAQLRQAGYNQALTSAGQDVGYGLQQGQQRLQQGQQLGSLANLGLGMGQSVQNQQTQQGLQQQMMNQALIDAAKQQYAGYTGAPLGSLNAPLAAIGAGSVGQGTTTGGKQPGLYDYLALGASLYNPTQ